MTKSIQLPYGKEEARKHVYRYLHANGFYPLNEDYTTFERSSRKNRFSDPRRWKLQLNIQYKQTEKGTVIELSLHFLHGLFHLDELRNYLFRKSDRKYYSDFFQHLEIALKKQIHEQFETTQDPISYKPTYEVMALFFLLVLVPLTAILEFNWSMVFIDYIWPAVFVGFLFWVITDYVRFSRKTIQL